MIQTNQIVNQESFSYLEKLDFKNEGFFYCCLITIIKLCCLGDKLCLTLF